MDEIKEEEKQEKCQLVSISSVTELVLTNQHTTSTIADAAAVAVAMDCVSKVVLFSSIAFIVFCPLVFLHCFLSFYFTLSHS